MSWRSVWAVVAGILVAVVLTTLIDMALHSAGVYPPITVPIDNTLALLATSYRVVIGIGAAWLTARLAPRNPMKHVLILGALGFVVALVGVIVTWNRDLGPKWYPISLVILAIPQSWLGGRLFESRWSRQASKPESATGAARVD
jgi:MFS family permease